MFETVYTLLPIAQAIAPAQNQESLDQWVAWGYGLLCVFLIFVLPFLIGNWISRAIRMPNASTKIGTRVGIVLATVIAALLVSFSGVLKYGIDIRGGTILVYEILDQASLDPSAQRADPKALASALSLRLNPSGTKEMSIRPYGESQIEIVVPYVDEFEVYEIKRLIGQAGALKFRIVANSRDHQDIIELARQQAASDDPNVRSRREVLNSDGKTVGMWFTVGRKETELNGIHPMQTPVNTDIVRNSQTGAIIIDSPRVRPPLSDDEYALEKWMAAEKIADIDVLMALERSGEVFEQISGDDLSGAAFTYDQRGTPAVDFTLGAQGAGKMLNLTGLNQPESGFHRRMAIILDERVLSAPQLNSPIGASGQITGNFTREEADFLVQILRSGRLPATLSSNPSSEHRVGALLGESTIQKGTYASILSMIVTLLSILVYYRFAGVVAAIALIMNGLFIYAAMVLIRQPLTLPGLAGLVLTLGMSVDANVLIYERMREEVARGSAIRMAIRNGFDRALTAIVDSNLTTIISAIVLYWIGTDQVRGFAVALIIGIVISMFTAIFCSRVMFDIAEKLRFANLSMMDGIGWLRKMLIGKADIDFMGMQKICIGTSAALIALGLILVAIRGKDILDIDFTGGTSVTFQLEKPVGADELRELTQQILVKDDDGRPIQSTLQHVEVKDAPVNTVYKLDTSVTSLDQLRQRMADGFSKSSATHLVNYRVNVSQRPASKIGGNPQSSIRNVPVGRFVAAQAPTQTPAATATAATPTTANADAVPPSTASDSTTPKPAASPTATAAEIEKFPEDPKSATAITGVVPTADAAIPQGSTEFLLQFVASSEKAPAAQINGPELVKRLIEAAKAAGITLTDTQIGINPEPKPAGWKRDDVAGFSDWVVSLPLANAGAKSVTEQLQKIVGQQPVWISVSNIGGRVAGDMQQKAIGALLVSLIFIIAYIWFRFQKISYGLAAVVALIHDVLITLGFVAACHWLAGPFSFIMIEDFKIGLTMVAAFLTIIGYSLNDTIVIFDRIREVRGKSPRLTAEIINVSVNQTLSRTLLTSSTTLMVILLLYFFGGEGIHGFMFTLFVGIVVGTFSSVFVASPVLLWIAKRQEQNVRRIAEAKSA